MSEKKETAEMAKLKEIWEATGKTDTAKASETKGAFKMTEAAEAANVTEMMKKLEEIKLEETEKMPDDPDGKEGQEPGNELPAEGQSEGRAVERAEGQSEERAEEQSEERAEEQESGQAEEQTEGKLVNEMRLCFLSRGENESLARIAVAGFIAWLDPTLDVLDDIRTAVSEAVTNAIIHGYPGKQDENIYLSAFLYEQGEAGYMLRVDVEDTGTGIEDVPKAMEPLYSTSPDGERAGMGFTFMKAFTDCLTVDSKPQLGTCVSMLKRLPMPEASHDAE